MRSPSPGPTVRRSSACVRGVGRRPACSSRASPSGTATGSSMRLPLSDRAGRWAAIARRTSSGSSPECFDPGDTPFPVFELGGPRVGVMICFDWVFPEAARSLALRGADVIAHPSNLVTPGWCQKAMQVRALENMVATATGQPLRRRAPRAPPRLALHGREPDRRAVGHGAGPCASGRRSRRARGRRIQGHPGQAVSVGQRVVAGPAPRSLWRTAEVTSALVRARFGHVVERLDTFLRRRPNKRPTEPPDSHR